MTTSTTPIMLNASTTSTVSSSRRPGRVLRFLVPGTPETELFRLYSFSNNSPNLTVQPPPHWWPTTQQFATLDHPIYGLGNGGPKQVVHSFVHKPHLNVGVEGDTGCSEDSKRDMGGDDVPKEVALKWGRGQHQLLRLAREHELYMNDLRYLQGKVVPRNYGMYVGVVEGREVGCLVLEWCDSSTLVEENDFMCQMMGAATKIHAAGIMHNALADRKHRVVDKNRKLRIVGFGNATRHKCPGSVPRSFNPENGPSPAGCSELDALDEMFVDDGHRYLWSPIEMRRSGSCHMLSDV
ncbi:unnamed protein product [Somion occarium]|uniref:Protein kinase domain-containing protein n=1 Tax=Somion occarium TaxID=3059160 RepID=A0ABP1CES9_9APHY